MGCSASTGYLSTDVLSDRGPKRSTHDPVREAFLKNELLVDSRCPLKSRELFSLTKSWKTINKNMAVTAINMFVRLFEASEGIRDMFASFKHVTNIAQLKSSAVFEGHAMKVLFTIDDVIANFDDVDYVMKRLEDVAHFHSHTLQSFQPQFFTLLEEPFIAAVQEEFGQLFTVSMEKTYRTTIRFILVTLVKEFNCHLAKKSAEIHHQSKGGATDKESDSLSSIMPFH